MVAWSIGLPTLHASTVQRPPAICTTQRDRADSLRAATNAAATAPVPHARVSPTPRSHTRIASLPRRWITHHTIDVRWGKA